MLNLSDGIQLEERKPGRFHLHSEVLMPQWKKVVFIFNGKGYYRNI